MACGGRKNRLRHPSAASACSVCHWSDSRGACRRPLVSLARIVTGSDLANRRLVHWPQEVMGHEDGRAGRLPSRLGRDLTLILMYLTSWHKGPDEVRRCRRAFSPEIIHELAGDGIVQERSGNKTIALTEQGEEEALLLLDRYGFGIPNGAPLTLREIRWAVSQWPAGEREALIRDEIHPRTTASPSGWPEEKGRQRMLTPYVHNRLNPFKDHHS